MDDATAARIKELCDATVADLTIKVRDERWNATVAECKRLTKEARKARPKRTQRVKKVKSMMDWDL
jgi:hypothetical protein